MAASVITENIMVLTVTPTELAALKSTPDVDLIDVRDPNEWETGHIPGARLVPLDRFRADPKAALIPGKTIVFICAKGIRSLAAAKLAERFGYERIYNLEGGTKGWIAEGRPVIVETSVAA
jgi:rhodanese-related sulfurtransferase